jgi:hypothetical protein
MVAVPDAVLLSADDLAVIPPPFSPTEISMANQEESEDAIEFRCDSMEVSEEQAENTAPYPTERMNSLVDDNGEVSINCTMAGSVRILMVKPSDTIWSLKILLAAAYECAVTEVHIIFKGRIISSDDKRSLYTCGVKSGSKLHILKRPMSRTWFQLKVHFPMTGETPLSFRMHSSSTTLNVKKQLQELIGCPYKDVCLFLADGLSMNDEVSLRDYNVHNLEDVYCIINPASTPQEVLIPLGEKAPFVSIKLSADKLMEHIVRNQALRDRAPKCSDSKKVKTIDANSDDASLRVVTGSSGSENVSKGIIPLPDEPSSKRRETFLGMRKGFLFAGKSRTKTKSDRASIPSTTPEHTLLPAADKELCSLDLDVQRPRNSASTVAAERARKAGIPENLRTGRASVVASADGSLAHLQKLLKDALTPTGGGSADFAAAAKAEPSICSPELETPKQLLPTAQAQKQGGRCEACRAKVGLTAITCRCGGTYCARHRYAEAHCCQFDYKTFQRSRSTSVPRNGYSIFILVVENHVEALRQFLLQSASAVSSSRRAKAGGENLSKIVGWCFILFQPRRHLPAMKG